MVTHIFDNEVTQTIKDIQAAAQQPQFKTITVDGQAQPVPYPFPSPGDWRDCWIYFLMIDRFNNPAASPRSTPGIAWNQPYNFRQGGTFKGVQEQMGYIADLGARAIWLSPVLKNARPNWQYNY